jgi:hypothetical protein
MIGIQQGVITLGKIEAGKDDQQGQDQVIGISG